MFSTYCLYDNKNLPLTHEQNRCFGLQSYGHSLHHQWDTFSACTWLHTNSSLKCTAVSQFRGRIIQETQAVKVWPLEDQAEPAPPLRMGFSSWTLTSSYSGAPVNSRLSAHHPGLQKFHLFSFAESERTAAVVFPIAVLPMLNASELNVQKMNFLLITDVMLMKCRQLKKGSLVYMYTSHYIFAIL